MIFTTQYFGKTLLVVSFFFREYRLGFKDRLNWHSLRLNSSPSTVNWHSLRLNNSPSAAKSKPHHVHKESDLASDAAMIAFKKSWRTHTAACTSESGLASS